MELIEFDINTNAWSIDGFAFSEDGGLNPLDLEWLCDVEVMTSEEFVLTGYEKLQEAFFENSELDADNLQAARDWCEQIVIIRFMELVRASHIKASAKKLKWAKVPLYFTEHGYDFIIKSEN